MEETLTELWSKRITAYQKSGQTMKAWCAEQSLTVHQLKYWLYKAQRQQLSNSATFRAVTVTLPEPENDPLWIQVSSARIVVRSGFEPQLLRDVVAALGAEC